MAGAGVVLLLVLFITFFVLWPEETVDVALIEPELKDSLTNQTKPISLGRRVVLRNLLLGLTSLQERAKEQQARLMEAQAEQHQDVQRRLVDLKAAQGDLGERMRRDLAELRQQLQEGQAKALQELRQGMEQALQEAVSQQKEWAQEEAQLLQRIQRITAEREAMWEYSRARPSRQRNFTENVVSEDAVEQWEQRTFRHYGNYGFVRFSAYRVSRSRVAVLGLAARAQRDTRRLTWCRWHSVDGSVIEGTLSLLPVSGESPNFMVLPCTRWWW